MGKSENRQTLDDAERAAREVSSVTPPVGHTLESTSGVERDFREINAAR